MTSDRLEAFQELQRIVSDMSAKLHKDEASAIKWAAEGLLLSADDQEAVESITAFNTLFDGDGFQARWEDNRPTERRLRDAFARCAPVGEPALI
jgi:hypothetical protein